MIVIVDKFDKLAVAIQNMVDANSLIITAKTEDKNVSRETKPDIFRYLDEQANVVFNLLLKHFSEPLDNEADHKTILAVRAFGDVAASPELDRFNSFEAEAMRSAPYSDPVKSVLIARAMFTTMRLPLSTANMADFGPWAERFKPVVM